MKTYVCSVYNDQPAPAMSEKCYLFVYYYFYYYYLVNQCMLQELYIVLNNV